MSESLRVLDLFSGIGGFSLGLERTGGFRTVAFCEIDPYCRAVIAKHWSGVPIFGDIRELTAKTLAGNTHGQNVPKIRGIRERSGTDTGRICDIICGGFPCQDISFAGKGAGLAGERSGLWSEYLRLIGEIRPRYVIVENVSALLNRGLDTVIGNLAEIGYDTEWHCIPASHVGAPHRRDRVWIVAYPNSGGLPKQAVCEKLSERAEVIGASQTLSDTDGQNEHDGPIDAEMACAPQSRPDMADAYASGFQGTGSLESASQQDWGAIIASGSKHGWQWSAEPDVGRVAHGVPSRVDRLKALGNAVVPQVVEIIGRAILRHAT